METLDNIPKNLEEMYGKILKGIPSEYAGIARSILLWLAFSFRPLTLQEVAAVASLPQPSNVLQICTSSFVTSFQQYLNIDGRIMKCEIVKLDHFSVKEYLATPNFCKSKVLAHLTIAADSVDHLLEANQSDPLLSYSARYWHEHVREAESKDINTETVKSRAQIRMRKTEAEKQAEKQEAEELRAQIHSIFCEENSRSYLNWLCLHNPERSWANWRRLLPLGRGPPPPPPWPRSQPSDLAKPAKPLYYASLLGLLDNVERLLKQGAEVNARGGLFKNALRAAAVCGHSKVVEQLLNKQAEVNTLDIIFIAQVNERSGSEVMEVLLKYKGDIVISEEVMQAAAANRYNSLEVMEFLLKYKGDIAISEKVIQAAAANRYKGLDVIEVLLKHKGGIAISEEFMQAVAANEYYGSKVMEVLLEHKGDIAISKEVMQVAAANKSKGLEVIEVLLKHKGDIAISEEVMQAAAANEYNGSKVIEVLLKHRGNIAISDEVMQVAAANGHDPNRKVTLRRLAEEEEAAEFRRYRRRSDSVSTMSGAESPASVVSSEEDPAERRRRRRLGKSQRLPTWDNE